MREEEGKERKGVWRYINGVGVWDKFFERR
jgi:hypothetical protein